MNHNECVSNKSLKVKIKTWDKMVREYGVSLDTLGIGTRIIFLRRMEELMPIDRIIILGDPYINGKTVAGKWVVGKEWFLINEQMIEEIIMDKEAKINQLEREMQKCCNDFKRRIEELKESDFINPMKPKLGEMYYYINHNGIFKAIKSGHIIDNQRYNSGNCFTNKDLAESVHNRETLHRLMLRDALDSFEGNYPEIDEDCRRYYLGYINYNDCVIYFDYDEDGGYSIIGCWFKTEEDLINSISKHRTLFDEVYKTKGFKIS